MPDLAFATPIGAGGVRLRRRGLPATWVDSCRCTPAGTLPLVPWYTCDPSTCLPANNCQCATQASPLPADQMPQFILYTVRRPTPADPLHAKTAAGLLLHAAVHQQCLKRRRAVNAPHQLCTSCECTSSVVKIVAIPTHSGTQIHRTLLSLGCLQHDDGIVPDIVAAVNKTVGSRKNPNGCGIPLTW